MDTLYDFLSENNINYMYVNNALSDLLTFGIPKFLEFKLDILWER